VSGPPGGPPQPERRPPGQPRWRSLARWTNLVARRREGLPPLPLVCWSLALLPVTVLFVSWFGNPELPWWPGAGPFRSAFLFFAPVAALSWFLTTVSIIRAMRSGDLAGPERLAATSRLSPLLLLDEWRRPLVRAMRIGTRRWRLRSLAGCAAVPLLAALALPLLADRLPGRAAEELAGAFACFWPAVCFAGAAAASAASAAAERREGTAVQLVLSPIPKREIAAAKVLPYVWPYLAGALAALPLLALLGTSRGLLAEGEGIGPQAAWPMRMFVMVDGDWRFRLTAGGILNALAMALGDAAAVWAAAHWGAALAVRLGSLGLAAVWLIPRVLALAAWAALAWAGAWLCAAVIGAIFGSAGGDADAAPAALVVAWLVGLPLYALGWWAFLAIWPVQGALRAFEQFDRLADDRFQLQLRERLDSRHFTEHLRIRRL